MYSTHGFSLLSLYIFVSFYMVSRVGLSEKRKIVLHWDPLSPISPFARGPYSPVIFPAAVTLLMTLFCISVELSACRPSSGVLFLHSS